MDAQYTPGHSETAVAFMARRQAYLAEQLERAGAGEEAGALRRWAERPAAMFAQIWVSALARN